MCIHILSSSPNSPSQALISVTAVLGTILSLPLQLTVNVLSDDLQDGLVLIAMLETLAAPKKVGPYNKNPKIKPQLIENLNAVFKFLAKENVKVVNISESFLAQWHLLAVCTYIYSLRMVLLRI